MSSMTVSNMNKYFQKFIEQNIKSENTQEKLLSAWQEESTQKEITAILKKTEKKSKIKDPNKPKRNKTAYIFYCMDMRDSVKEDMHDGAKSTEITSELGKRWKKLNDKKKEKYNKLAVADKKRYATEMKDYEPSSDFSTGSNKKKDPNKPKRNKTAYIFYCMDMRDSVKEDMHDGAKSTEITSELGKRWKKLSDKKKEKYDKLAVADKKRYMTEMKNYEPPSESDSDSKKKKMKKSKKEEEEDEEEEKEEEEDEKEDEKEEEEEEEEEENEKEEE